MADLLVVEDDTDAAETLAEVLQLEGHRVRIAVDGEQGLRRLHERVPDLVLLDIEMPVLSGPGMAAKILLHDLGLEKVPILLMSGVPNLPHVASEIGTLYFLSKPYTYEQLIGLVARALSEHTPPNPPPSS